MVVSCSLFAGIKRIIVAISVGYFAFRRFGAASLNAGLIMRRHT